MVTSIIQQADYNHSGQVDYTEYLVSAINKEKLLTKDKLNKAFELFDLVCSCADQQDGDGLITKEEWEGCFGNTKMTIGDWNIFLEDVDTNKDGQISREEFFNFLEKMAVR